LRRTEEADGNLRGIVERLRQHGQMTDDLSLLRLAYRSDENSTEAMKDPDYAEVFRKSASLLREGRLEEGLSELAEICARFPDFYEPYLYRGRAFFKLKRYKEAAESLLKYCEQSPGDNETLYVLSQSFKRSGEYDRAADFCERLALREPGRIHFLVNLADCHRLASNWERAADTMKRAAALDPENPMVHRMNEILAKRRR